MPVTRFLKAHDLLGTDAVGTSMGAVSAGVGAAGRRAGRGGFARSWWILAGLGGSRFLLLGSGVSTLGAIPAIGHAPCHGQPGSAVGFR